MSADAYVPPPLDPAIRQAIDAYAARRRTEIARDGLG